VTVERFEVQVRGGTLVGSVAGEGPGVLLLHGGPGLSDYLDGLLPELVGLRVARFQQRGLAPSTAREPYDVAVQVDDVVAVLDHLGWTSPLVVGHSWGGHLLLHLLATQPGRVGAAVAVDTLGAVGDGGGEAFEAELVRRTPADVRERARELDRRAMAGEGTSEEARESMDLVWPAYFSAWEKAPPPFDIAIGVEAYAETMQSVAAELPGLAARLRGVRVPTRFVHGALSPMPVTASTDSAELLGAEVDVVADCGHFLWLEAPGSVRRNVDALLPEIVRQDWSSEGGR
jgi:proline iminopeptidase